MVDFSGKKHNKSTDQKMYSIKSNHQISMKYVAKDAK